MSRKNAHIYNGARYCSPRIPRYSQQDKTWQYNHYKSRKKENIILTERHLPPVPKNPISKKVGTHKIPPGNHHKIILYLPTPILIHFLHTPHSTHRHTERGGRGRDRQIA